MIWQLIILYSLATPVLVPGELASPDTVIMERINFQQKKECNDAILARLDTLGSEIELISAECKMEKPEQQPSNH